ncbi:sugar phosphate isomerase/epimerase family protein [Pacificoceanicola onchidii]|uniref:sugar phosphate isomerase/epimerase family protein n=1 Tax=Pacificoceanicola onchidii TaxID=2562685 RepID=UPI0010A5EEAA|nr:sugar phosphate isomerase/epimerase [Pacificoceanicola onchidii]
MNKLGVHALVFSDTWNAESAKIACDNAARIGFDLIEVLVFDPAALDVEMTRRAAKDAGVELRLGMALGPGSDLSSLEQEVHAAGKRDVIRCLEIASELETPGVSGITYAAFNAYDAPHNDAQYEQVVEAFSGLDEKAGELGVRLGIEPVNRYESYMIQTLDQGAKLIADSGTKNTFLHMDTFHMNIEEGDLADTIARNGTLLGYAHLAENDRGILGAGSFDFTAYFRALAQAGYEGDFTVESFSPAVLGKDIVGAIGLWRTPWTSSNAAAKSALNFMRNQVEKARESVIVW